MLAAQQINSLLRLQGILVVRPSMVTNTMSSRAVAALTGVSLSRSVVGSRRCLTTTVPPRPEPNTPRSTASSNPTPPKKAEEEKHRHAGFTPDSIICSKDRAFYPYHMDIQLRWSDTSRASGAHQPATHQSSHAHPPYNDLFETVVHTYLVEEAGLKELASKIKSSGVNEEEKKAARGENLNRKDIAVMTTEYAVESVSDSEKDLELIFPGTVEVRLAVLGMDPDASSLQYQVGVFKKLGVSDPSLTLQSNSSNSGEFSRDAWVAEKGSKAAAGAAGTDREADGCDPRFHPSQVQGDAVIVGRLSQDFVDRWNGVRVSIPERARKALERLRRR
ncbi:hypothetical protein BGX28_003713 [Mortierella sp. GBA30]|nr:hypothetical protein BGX28_003713 [Mortierella sp. GBA30]